MKKVICDIYNGYDARVREIRLVFNTDKMKGYGWDYTVLIASVRYVRPQKSLDGDNFGVYVFQKASDFIKFLKKLNLSEGWMKDIWTEIGNNDRIDDELGEFIDDEYEYGKEKEHLKAMYEAV